MTRDESLHLLHFVFNMFQINFQLGNLLVLQLDLLRFHVYDSVQAPNRVVQLGN